MSLLDPGINAQQRSVCVVSEDLSYPLDEGIKLFAYSLIQSWPGDGPVLGLSVRSRGEVKAPNTVSMRVNKLFLSWKLWRRIRQFKPHLVCYVPSASATVFSFLRSRVLGLCWPRAEVVLVSLQPRRYGWLSRRLIRFLSPDRVFVQTEETLRHMAVLRCPVKLIPSGVELDRFVPVSLERKAELRSKYGLEREAFTVLHVGHVKEERNVQFLARVCRELDAQVVLVGSSLPGQDMALSAFLREQRVTVFDEYLPDIQELYQLSDCYLFPVFSDQACIGTPLSVLEAMACNLPVITCRYGSLPTLFEAGRGLVFADTPEELLQGVAQAKRSGCCETRKKVTSYSWQSIAKSIMDHRESK